jgi:uncharacterized protein (DUF58 family)
MRGISELLPPEALARLTNLGLVARWVVEGFISGLHASPYHGFSVEFAEYRSYTPGDDLRHLDWKALAKSDRTYVKKYHSETNTRIHLLLDSSASMGFGAPVSKFRYAQAMAAALAYLMILQQDAAGLVLFADRILRYLRPKATMQHFRDIAASLQQARPQSTTDCSEALHRLAETLKARGLVVLFSDLYDDPEKIRLGLRHLRFRKHEIILFHLLDRRELDFPYGALTEFRDLETGERIQVLPSAHRPAYRKALDAFCADLRRECSNMLIDYHVVDTSVPFDQVLAQYLARRQRYG